VVRCAPEGPRQEYLARSAATYGERGGGTRSEPSPAWWMSAVAATSYHVEALDIEGKKELLLTGPARQTDGGSSGVPRSAGRGSKPMLRRAEGLLRQPLHAHHVTGGAIQRKENPRRGHHGHRHGERRHGQQGRSPRGHDGEVTRRAGWLPIRG